MKYVDKVVFLAIFCISCTQSEPYLTVFSFGYIVCSFVLMMPFFGTQALKTIRALRLYNFAELFLQVLFQAPFFEVSPKQANCTLRTVRRCVGTECVSISNSGNST